MARKEIGILKVILFADFGSNYCTPDMLKIMERASFPANRTGEIIDYVEQHAIKKDERTLTEEFIKKNKGSIIQCSPGRYITWGENFCASYEIVDVDITRPWHIEDYDGYERVQYLDFDILDPQLNYCISKR